MVPVNSFAYRVEEIQTLLATGEIKRSMRRLLDFVWDFSNSAELKMSANILNEKYAQLLLQHKDSFYSADIEQERNNLLTGILSLIDQVEIEVLSTFETGK